MRFMVSAEDRYLAFNHSGFGENWRATCYAIPAGVDAAVAEVRAENVLDCLGRAKFVVQRPFWDISRDDLSVGQVIDLCTLIAFLPKFLNEEDCIHRVTVKIARAAGATMYSVLEGQIKSEIARSFKANKQARSQRYER